MLKCVTVAKFTMSMKLITLTDTCKLVHTILQWNDIAQAVCIRFATNFIFNIKKSENERGNGENLSKWWRDKMYVNILWCSLQWRYNERDIASNCQRFDCFLNRLFRRRSKKTTKLRVTGLCEGNSPVIGEFPVQRTSNGENVFILWRHHIILEKITTRYMVNTVDDIKIIRIRYTQQACHDQCWKFYADSYKLTIPSLQWRNNERDGVSNQQPHDCLLTHLSRRR